MTRLACFVAFSVLAAAPALADATTATDTAATTASPAKPKLICEHEDEIGTRLGGHRVCKTAAQWAEERRAAREAVDRAQTVRACNIGAGC